MRRYCQEGTPPPTENTCSHVGLLFHILTVHIDHLPSSQLPSDYSIPNHGRQGGIPDASAHGGCGTAAAAAVATVIGEQLALRKAVAADDVAAMTRSLGMCCFGCSTYRGVF